MKTEKNGPILLVEGNLDDEERLVRAYERTGHRSRLLVARTTENALTLLRACAKGIRFKLIVLDLHIPRCGAFEFITRLRRDPLIADTPVALLIPPETASTEMIAHLNGMLAFITKTRDAPSLIDLWNEVLESLHPSNDQFGGRTSQVNASVRSSYERNRAS
jgi:CheY-like chemotaxis protein